MSYPVGRKRLIKHDLRARAEHRMQCSRRIGQNNPDRGTARRQFDQFLQGDMRLFYRIVNDDGVVMMLDRLRKRAEGFAAAIELHFQVLKYATDHPDSVWIIAK